MATPVNGDLLEIKYYCTTLNQNGINVVQYRVSAVIGGGLTDIEIAAGMGAVAAPVYKAYLPPSAKYAGLRLMFLEKDPLPLPISDTGGNGVGVLAGDLMSTQTAGILEKQTNFGGPSGRGRMYLPFICEASNDANGRPNAAWLVLAAALGTALLTARVLVVGGRQTTLTPIIYDRLDGARTDIATFTPGSDWATQKRRSQVNRADNLGP